MSARVKEALRAGLQGSPRLLDTLRGARTRAQALRHSMARRVPGLISARTTNLTVAITAGCNYRCTGCLYERGFMAGSSLPLDVTLDMLEDAGQAGVDNVRFYGGEPLLHPDLPAMIEGARKFGVDPYVTTNGLLLGKRIDDLVSAGLEYLTVGFYGVGEEYDRYVGRPGAFERFERSLDTVREKYGTSVGLRMNWLLHRESCNVEAVEQAIELAAKYEAPMQVDLVHYSLPYFTEGEDRHLQFKDGDRPMIEPVVHRLLQAKRETPDLIEGSEMGLRSIPDWLVLGPDMKVACDKYEMLWIGADGTVQLCYVMFELGNLHETRLREMLYGPEHEDAARKAFCLECTNCHCGYDSRTRKDLRSRLRYGKPLPGELG